VISNRKSKAKEIRVKQHWKKMEAFRLKLWRTPAVRGVFMKVCRVCRISPQAPRVCGYGRLGAAFDPETRVRSIERPNQSAQTVSLRFDRVSPTLPAFFALSVFHKNTGQACMADFHLLLFPGSS
jgi:hypothetical protein